MMKWGKQVRRGAARILTAAMVVGAISVPVSSLARNAGLDEEALSQKKAEVMTVNLGAGGLGKPEAAKKVSSEWANGIGDYLYFGSYYQQEKQQKTAVKWRLLDAADGNLLLLSDRVLDRVRFHETRQNVSWADSNIRKWLNSDESGWEGDSYAAEGFLDTAFGTIEQSAIAAAEKEAEDDWGNYGNPGLTGEKIFLLSAAEAAGQDGGGYGFYRENSVNQESPVSRVLTSTAYASGQGAMTFESETLGREAASWWLRSSYSGGSKPDASIIDAYLAQVSGTNVTGSLVGVAPALNLQTSAVRLLTKSGMEREVFSATEAAEKSSAREWDVTLADGNEGFEARVAKAASVGVDGGTVKVSVSGVTSGELASTQVSALLADANGTVLAYGKVAEPSAVEAEIVLPSGLGLKNGRTYNLYVFSERVSEDSQVSYASNLAGISLTVGTVLPMEEEYARTVKMSASSVATLSNADYAYDGDEETAWSPFDKDTSPSITMEFNRKAAVERFALAGSPQLCSGYQVEMKKGDVWETVFTSENALEAEKEIYIQGAEICEGTGFRLAFTDVQEGFCISEITLYAFQNQAMEDENTFVEITAPENGETAINDAYQKRCLIDGDRIGGKKSGAWATGTYNDRYPAEAMISFAYPLPIDEIRILSIQDTVAGPNEWEWQQDPRGVIPDEELTSKFTTEYKYTVSYYDNDAQEWVEFGSYDRAETDKKVLARIEADEPVTAARIKVEAKTWYWVMLAEIEPVISVDIQHVVPGEEETYMLTVEGGQIISANGMELDETAAEIPEGVKVIIRADEKAAFETWKVLLAPAGFGLADASAAETAFLMPAGAVRVRAVSEVASPSDAAAVTKADPAGWAYAKDEGLKALLADSDIITDTDKEILEKGGTVEVTFLTTRKGSGYSGAGIAELKKLIDGEREEVAFTVKNSLSKKTVSGGSANTVALATASNAVPVVMTLPGVWQKLEDDDYRLLSYENEGWQDENFNWDIDGVAMEYEAGVNGTYAVVVAKYYTVTYKDWDGTVIKKDKVRYGEDSTPPRVPERDGYLFSKWSRDYRNVTKDITVTAKYKLAESSGGVKDILENILETLTELEGSPMELEAEVSYQIDRVNRLSLGSYKADEEVWMLIKEIEERVAFLTGVEIPDVANGSGTISGGTVVGAIFSQPVCEGGSVYVSDAEMPTIKNLANALAFDVRLKDVSGKEWTVKAMYCLTLDLPENLDLNQELVVVDGSGKALTFWIEGGQITVVIEKNGTVVIGNQAAEQEKPSDGSHHSGSSGSSGGSSDSSSSFGSVRQDTVSGTWTMDENGWRFRQSDGSYCTSIWAVIGGRWYHFDQNSYAQRGWYQENGIWYFLKESCAMAESEWTCQNGIWYYLEDSGAMAANRWVMWNGEFYYLGADGAMLTGQTAPDGNQVDKNGVWIRSVR